MGVGAPTIILADDDADLRAVYGPCLREAGYAVVEAVNGREALESVRALRPELLLLDLWMPGLNGFEVLDRLRHEPAGSLLKIVMLSCVADADARLECFGAGADAFVVKGLPLAELLRRIEGALAEGLSRWSATRDRDEPPASSRSAPSPVS